MEHDLDNLPENQVVWLIIKTFTGRQGKVKGYKTNFSSKDGKHHSTFKSPNNTEIPHEVCGWENL
jgi:hypothetical protein